MKTKSYPAILVLISILLFCGCKYDNLLLPCLGHLGDEWEAYRGEDLGYECIYYITEEIWRGETYYLEGCTCCDMISIPWTCGGTPLCTTFSDPILSTFFIEAQSQGIVAILR